TGVSEGSAWAAVARGSTIAAAIAATVVLVSRPLVSRGRRSWPGGLFGFMVNALLRTWSCAHVLDRGGGAGCGPARAAAVSRRRRAGTPPGARGRRPGAGPGAAPPERLRSAAGGGRERRRGHGAVDLGRHLSGGQLGLTRRERRGDPGSLGDGEVLPAVRGRHGRRDVVGSFIGDRRDQD